MKGVRLNRRLILEVAQRVSDGAGGYDTTWQEQGQLWAQVVGRSGRLRDGGEVSLSSVGYRITVRAAPQGSAQRPEAGMRFRDDQRVYQIAGVTEQGPDGRYLTCFSTEEVAR